MKKTHRIMSYSVIPLRDVVVFPGTGMALFVGREKSVNALRDLDPEKREIVLLTQKKAQKEDPDISDLYKVGVIVSVRQVLKLPDGTVKIIVEGQDRVKVRTLENLSSGFVASVEPFPSLLSNESDGKALMRVLKKRLAHYAKLHGEFSADALRNLLSIKSCEVFVNTLAQHSKMTIEELQTLIEQEDILKALEMLCVHVEKEISTINIDKDVYERIRKQMEKNQREYYLNEKMKAISKELKDDTVSDLDTYKKRLDSSRMPADVKTKLRGELKKIKTMPPISAESSLLRNYVELLLDLPWKKRSRVNGDIRRAKQVLDADHYGLEKVKEHILELLAVAIRTKKVKGPIICLVGPPGVGKTSLGESMARACGRKFVRVSLGGVRDEADIRGHRRTYIGSMPGRIIQGLKKVGSSNPVFLLDEIEKMGYDYRGDPSAALLEILDSAQNKTFVDHYVEVEYDLSEVMFVATANSLDMPAPLLDRMEIIRLVGYTEEEKIEIAKRHLLQRVIEDAGFKEDEFSISDDALRFLIRHYTREAGVRDLERNIQKLARKSIYSILKKEASKIHLTAKDLKTHLGPIRFTFDLVESADCIGMVTGLAWTSFGGEILQIESALVYGKGKVIKTGKLGTVMQESISAAETYVRANCLSLGVLPAIFAKSDIHVHVPEGAIPKDGPSAGIAMVTAIVSSLTDNPVKRDVAMTGEVTLRGKVLAIGGLKEKLLAALRSGIRKVLIPASNQKDLIDIPSKVIDKLEIIPVENVGDVLKIALKNTVKPIKWDQDLSTVQRLTKENIGTLQQ